MQAEGALTKVSSSGLRGDPRLGLALVMMVSVQCWVNGRVRLHGKPSLRDAGHGQKGSVAPLEASHETRRSNYCLNKGRRSS